MLPARKEHEAGITDQVICNEEKQCVPQRPLAVCQDRAIDSHDNKHPNSLFSLPAVPCRVGKILNRSVLSARFFFPGIVVISLGAAPKILYIVPGERSWIFLSPG